MQNRQSPIEELTQTLLKLGYSHGRIKKMIEEVAAGYFAGKITDEESGKLIKALEESVRFAVACHKVGKVD